jgi:hypothetical protein
MLLCYQQGLLSNPSLTGRVTVRFLIREDGSVASASAASELPDPRVGPCIAAAFASLSFGSVDEHVGGTVAVSYPMMLLPE